MWATIGAIGLVGALLLVKALVGRRVASPPWCRGCGFELTGLVPETGPAIGDTTESHKPRGKCPECGTDLRPANAIRRWRRKRSRWQLGASATLVIAAAGWAGVLGWGAAKGLNWNTYKPTSMLIWETGWRSEPAVIDALTELTVRLGAGELNAQQKTEILVKALAIQADPKARWLRAWGDFVESLNSSGDLAEQDWERYLRNGVVLDVRARPWIRRGDPVPVQFQPRCRFGSTNRFSLSLGEPVVRIAGRRVLSIVSQSFSSTPSLGQASSVIQRFATGPTWHRDQLGPWVPAWSPDPSEKIETGPQRLTIDVSAHKTSGMMLNLNDDSAISKLHFEFPVEVLASDVNTDISALAGPLAQEDARQWIKSPEHVMLGWQSGSGFEGWNSSVFLTFLSPPCDLAFDVFCRTGDMEWHVGRVIHGCNPVEVNPLTVFLRDPRERTGRILSAQEAKDLSVVDVVLRPSAEAARASLGIRSIWMGPEIVFGGIPVTRMGGPSAP